MVCIGKLGEEKTKMGKNIKPVSLVMPALVGAAGAYVATRKVDEKKTRIVKEYSDKHLALFLMMNQWVKVKQEGKHLAEYFEKNRYKNIAIYGMGYVGKTLLAELNDTDVKVSYAIDRNADSIYADVDVISIDDELKKVDVVVVTAITFFDELEDELSKKINCPIISLEDVLYEV
jgi:lactate dehydrogenase-like 2-hydroxyacid dehydrogenase